MCLSQVPVGQVPFSELVMLNKDSQTKMHKHFKTSFDIKGGFSKCLECSGNCKRCRRSIWFLFLRRIRIILAHTPTSSITGSYDPVMI